MRKDFTEEYENYLIGIINSVQPSNGFESVIDFFGDIWLRLKKAVGGLNVENYTDNMDEYHKSMLDMKNTSIEEIRKIFTDVRKEDSIGGENVNEIRQNMADPLYQYLARMNEMIGDPDAYSTADITANLSELTEILEEKFRKTSSAYSDEYEKYGGNQSNAYIRFIRGEVDFQEDIREIIHKYDPDADDAEITDMLNEMQSEGCRFMAYTNTLVGQYEMRQAEFEERFGFSLYDEDGNVNFDLIITDFWLYSGYHDGKYEHGLSADTGEPAWEEYLKSKNIDVDVVDIDLTVDNYDEISKNGEIITGYSPLRLRDENGVLKDTRSGGHATVITGVEVINGKKMFKVSSWGLVFYIDPDDYADSGMRINYQQVQY